MRAFPCLLSFFFCGRAGDFLGTRLGDLGVLLGPFHGP